MLYGRLYVGEWRGEVAGTNGDVDVAIAAVTSAFVFRSDARPGARPPHYDYDEQDSLPAKLHKGTHAYRGRGLARFQVSHR